MIMWNFEQNFWSLNPLMELYFKDIKEEDFTKDKSWSSMRMWCISLCGAIDSPAKNYTKQELHTFIYDSFLKERKSQIESLVQELNAFKPKSKKDKNKDKDTFNSFEDMARIVFDIDLDAPYIERLVEVTYPKTRKMLKKWEDKLNEWHDFIEKTTIDETTYDMIGKMMTQSHNMWKQYLAIKKDAEGEVVQQGIEGAKKSFLEEEFD